MKTKYFLLAAVAAVSLVSCSSDDFVGSENSPDKMQNNTIAFGSGFKAITRANEHVGADAANLLNKHFTVSGFKLNSSASATVFDNYVVNWQANTAGTTESNTNDWEYVGVEVAQPSSLYKADANPKVKQTIKYWDYTYDQYDFIAYSTGEATPVVDKVTASADANATNVVADGEVVVTAINYENMATKAYTIGGSRIDLAKCYIADMVSVYKDGTDPKYAYQQTVPLTFRSLASKVRMAIYETVPGYSVKEVHFYLNDSKKINETGDDVRDKDDEANLFTSGAADNDYFFTHGTYTVYFPTTRKGQFDDPDYNQAHASFAADANSSLTTQRFGKLQYSGKEGQEKAGDIYLGRTLNTASYANNKDYEIMLPNPAGTVLELRIDYTLVSIDGSGEEIHIYGAKAFVPSTYTQWLPNYAYTYIFKITDNTNGWTTNIIPDGETEPVDPAGLYPITFDAVVIDAVEGKQSTITTVATPSITTYQKGHDVSKDEYEANGEPIYIQVMKDGVLMDDLNATTPKRYLWEITAGETISEATVMDALNIRTSYSGGVLTGRNGIVMKLVEGVDATVTTIPCVDGNDISINAGEAAMFQPEAGKTYAYIYVEKDNKNTTFPTGFYFETAPDDWGTATYYTDIDCTTAAPADFKAGAYYQKVTNFNIDCAVKVIKIDE